MNSDSPTPQEPAADWPPWVRRVVLPYLKDSALWPVTFAILAHIAVLEALVLLLAWRSGTPLAIGFLILNIIVTCNPARLEWRYDRKVGPVTITVVILWLMTAVVTWWGDTNGYF